MKVLVIGASGMVGRAVYNAFGDSQIFGTCLKNPVDGMIQFDITKPADEIFKKIKPDVAILSSALTNADYCEDNREEARKINVTGAKNVIDSCKRHGTKLVYISTYYIFDGTEGLYAEDHKPNPLNYYGQTKLEAEREAAANDSLIVRPTNVFSTSDGKNFLAWLLKRMKNGEPIKAASDQFTNPISAPELAEAVKLLVDTDSVGAFNVGGSEYINRYEFAIRASEYYGYKAMVESVTTEELMQRAKRPLYCGLKTQKIEKLGFRPPKITESFSRMRGIEHA